MYDIVVIYRMMMHMYWFCVIYLEIDFKKLFKNIDIQTICDVIAGL